MQTCAKINLFLKVLGTRADGYHELETVFLPIPELFDDVTVTPSDKPSLSISCNMPELETDGNLCLKAARAFCNQTGLPQAFHVDLVKRIPVAAGL
ncbi:MAG: 4-(cytidine 5'-diphospho)-2-C-methyl-D-erythritol kinase, partial [Victivallales bacterium]|nr:4-(cytidine 5'-diphospho)-2-C-methyl-D-erythritol kinase [Victivallales bacterium]